MNNKERYINFIVDDLISKTEIDYEKEKIKFPFRSPTPLISFSSYLSVFPFARYVIERYGTRDEEVHTIFGVYKERLQNLINK